MEFKSKDSRGNEKQIILPKYVCKFVHSAIQTLCAVPVETFIHQCLTKNIYLAFDNNSPVFFVRQFRLDKFLKAILCGRKNIFQFGREKYFESADKQKMKIFILV